MRPTKEEYYMAISQLASLRSTCLSRKVGAVIVKWLIMHLVNI